MEYREIDFCCGWTIERAVKELHERAKDGNKYCGEFNGNKLTSDMSLDDAYMLCTGKTFDEFNKEQEENRQRLIREEEEHKRKIPELSKYWIEEGYLKINGICGINVFLFDLMIYTEEWNSVSA